MPDEKRCMVCGAIIPEGRHICLSCEGQEIPRTVPRIRTNGDKIRSMSNEQLAQYLNTLERRALFTDTFDSAKTWFKWLGSEVEKSWP